MSKPDLLGPWVRRFLLESLVGERNFAENTRRSDRDTLALLIPFIATATTTTVDRRPISDLAADGVRAHEVPVVPARQRFGYAGQTIPVEPIHTETRSRTLWCWGSVRGGEEASVRIDKVRHVVESHAAVHPTSLGVAPGQRDRAPSFAPAGCVTDQLRVPRTRRRRTSS